MKDIEKLRDSERNTLKKKLERLTDRERKDKRF